MYRCFFCVLACVNACFGIRSFPSGGPFSFDAVRVVGFERQDRHWCISRPPPTISAGQEACRHWACRKKRDGPTLSPGALSGTVNRGMDDFANRCVCGRRWILHKGVQLGTGLVLFRPAACLPLLRWGLLGAGGQTAELCRCTCVYCTPLCCFESNHGTCFCLHTRLIVG